jgi:hypothetical protein
VAGREQFVEHFGEPGLEHLDLSLGHWDLGGPVVGRGPLGPILPCRAAFSPEVLAANNRGADLVRVLGIDGLCTGRRHGLGTVLILVFLPALYSIWDRVKRPKTIRKRRRWSCRTPHLTRRRRRRDSERLEIGQPSAECLRGIFPALAMQRNLLNYDHNMIL